MSRILERVGLVVVGVLVGAGGLAIVQSTDGSSGSNLSANVTTGLSAPDLTELGVEPSTTTTTGAAPSDKADSDVDDEDTSTQGSATGGSEVEVYDDTVVLSDRVEESAAQVASATAGAVPALVVDLAPATNIFGNAPASPTATTAQPAPTTTVPVTTTTVAPRVSGRTVEGAEWRLLNGINGLRNRSGVNGISMNETAREEARRWSKYMAENNMFDHRPDITNGVVWTSAIGENVATGGDISDIHFGLWNSEGHRANILSVNFSEVGIGVWFDSSTNKYWVTEIFIG